MLGEGVVGRSAFLAHLRDPSKFKWRRERIRSRHTAGHMAYRVSFAIAVLELSEADMRRRVFVNEKLFQAFSPGVLLLPKEDEIPPKFSQSETIICR